MPHICHDPNAGRTTMSAADPGGGSAINDGAAARLAERLLGMRANREVIPEDPNHSVRWHEHDYPSPVARWNYHPEYELHLIRKGTGKFIVGDHIGTFEAGHLALVGSGLPHDWVSDLRPGEVLQGRDVLIQFDGKWVERAAWFCREWPRLNPCWNSPRVGSSSSDDQHGPPPFPWRRWGPPPDCSGFSISLTCWRFFRVRQSPTAATSP